MADFVLEGPKWDSTGLGTTGGIVTWAIDATISASFLTAISSAFADWAHYANIQFQEVASPTYSGGGCNILLTTSSVMPRSSSS